LPSNPDWRWLLDRDDSPWYPSAKLYRQDIPGDWERVLKRVAADLEHIHDGSSAVFDFRQLKPGGKE
jgi:hypothetical protein